MEFHSPVANFQVMHINRQLMRDPGRDREVWGTEIKEYKAAARWSFSLL